MKIREQLNALRDARAEYHTKAAALTSSQIAEETAKIKALHQNVQDILTDGAKNCPTCDGKAMALFHEGTPNPFEVGCPRCQNHRIREALPDDAVEKWNAASGERDEDRDIKYADGKVISEAFKGYMPPREPGTAVATIKDATGMVREQKTVRVRPGRE